VRQRLGIREIRHLHCWYDAQPHPFAHSTGTHCVYIVRELRRIEVAMGVDPAEHHAIMPELGPGL
jgi:hypothetical protein